MRRCSCVDMCMRMAHACTATAPPSTQLLLYREHVQQQEPALLNNGTSTNTTNSNNNYHQQCTRITTTNTTTNTNHNAATTLPPPSPDTHQFSFGGEIPLGEVVAPEVLPPPLTPGAHPSPSNLREQLVRGLRVVDVKHLCNTSRI